MPAGDDGVIKATMMHHLICSRRSSAAPTAGTESLYLLCGYGSGVSSTVSCPVDGYTSEDGRGITGMPPADGMFRWADFCIHFATGSMIGVANM